MPVPAALAPFLGVSKVTLAAAAMVYVFIMFQVRVKVRLARAARKQLKETGKIDTTTVARYNSTDPEVIQADRSLGNYLEQLPVFLITLWLHALYVDAGVSTTLGWVYLAFRVLYPFLFKITPAGHTPTVLISTVPNCALSAHSPTVPPCPHSPRCSHSNSVSPPFFLSLQTS